MTAVPPIVAAEPLRSLRGPYELEVLVDGSPARSFSHDGETQVLGRAGDRYVLRAGRRQ